MERPGRVYRLSQLLFWLLFRGLYRVQVCGVEHLPQRGPGLICANHIHFWDPLLLAAFVPRPIHFMAKEELFAIPGVRQFITHVGAFPVRRGRPDRRALRRALQLLQQDKIVGLFPEGTRQRSGRLASSQPGTGFLAAKSGVPVIPAAIEGPYVPLRAMTLRFGPPMTWPQVQRQHGRAAMEGIGSDIMEGIGRLLRN